MAYENNKRSKISSKYHSFLISSNCMESQSEAKKKRGDHICNFFSVKAVNSDCHIFWQILPAGMFGMLGLEAKKHSKHNVLHQSWHLICTHSVFATIRTEWKLLLSYIFSHHLILHSYVKCTNVFHPLHQKIWQIHRPSPTHRQGKFINIAHFIHNGNSKCFTLKEGK